MLDWIKEKLKIAGIILLILLALYIVLSVYFMKHFYLHSTVNGVPSNGASVEKVKESIGDAARDYSLTVVDEANDKEYSIDGKDLGLETSFADGKLESLIEDQNGFKWIYYLFKGKKYFSDTVVTFDEAALKKMVNEMEPVTTADYIETKDATCEFDGTSYVIVEEVYGTNIDKEAFLAALATKIESMQTVVGLEADKCYVQPKVLSDSKELKQQVSELNKRLDMNINYTLGGKVEVVPRETIATWIYPDEKGNIAYDRDAIAAFVAEMGKKYNTFGQAKTLNTSWGTTVTVPGGTYGWKIDEEAETEQLIADLEKGEDVSRDFVYKYTANSHDGNDYGNSYVEINLTAQHLYLYVDGSCVLDTDFVSGNTSKGNGTHVGAYYVMYCEKNAVLRGDNYTTPVSFWMPFHGNEGMHDATWRSSFGGQLYKTGGSHGCVNLPYSAAQTIFGYVSAGFPVLVYELPGTQNLRYEREVAETAMTAIDQIGEVSLDKKPSIDNARAVYDGLNEEQRSFVTNYDVLVQAEETYQALLDEKEKKDKDKTKKEKEVEEEEDGEDEEEADE